ncbi:TPA: MarR family transcriptional regulator [Burkholderia cenocepacia]|nr:MarR family transcriptional regulator [Burkholderia cenocepacia]
MSDDFSCDHLFVLSAQIAMLFDRAISRQTVAELGVTADQAVALLMLASGNCRHATDLARECAVDCSSMTRLIDRLEKRGLLTRSKCTEDRRAWILEATPGGRRIASEVPRILDDVHGRLLGDITSADKRRLRGMLRRLRGG